MTDKPWPIITAEEYRDIVYLKNSTWREDVKAFNTLIASKAQIKYAHYTESSTHALIIFNDKCKRSTHEALVILRPIEEEKPECECEPKRTKMTRNLQEDGSVILAHCEVDNKFCPECGKSLTQGESNGK